MRNNLVNNDYFHIPSRVHFMKFIKIALDWSGYCLVQKLCFKCVYLDNSRCVNPFNPRIDIFKIDFLACQCQKVIRLLKILINGNIYVSRLIK